MRSGRIYGLVRYTVWPDMRSSQIYGLVRYTVWPDMQSSRIYGLVRYTVWPDMRFGRFGKINSLAGYKDLFISSILSDIQPFYIQHLAGYLVQSLDPAGYFSRYLIYGLISNSASGFYQISLVIPNMPTVTDRIIWLLDNRYNPAIFILNYRYLPLNSSSSLSSKHLNSSLLYAAPSFFPLNCF